MPIVQISRIQHRRGKATDLPQLAAGELGWSVDTQRLLDTSVAPHSGHLNEFISSPLVLLSLFSLAHYFF